ncbi:MAG: SIMPL domain-containing protein [Pontixanthobacter sp.]
MHRFAFTAGIAAALSLPIALSAPATAAEIQIAATGPVVELSVSEQVKARPDIAEISAGVSSEAKTAVESMRMNAQEMSAVIARIKSLGIDEDDIQTTGINLNAQYDYDRQTQRQVFRGYQVSNRVSVTLRDVPRTGPILDALVAAGATDINGPNFSIDDDTAAKAQARRAAMDKARERAQQYADWSGYSGIRLLEISESISEGPPILMQRMATMDVQAASAPTPVEPGMVTSGVSLSVKYEMTR